MCRCPCSSGARAVVLRRFVRVSRGGNCSSGGGCVSLAGCVRRSVRSSAPPSQTSPTRPTTRTPASASPVLAPETLASSLASAAACSCAGPQRQPHLWPSVLRAGPTAWPLQPTKPRPDAAHSRPEVRKARAPATQTKRARLPAFSTEQDGAEKLADWRLSKVSLASGRGSSPGLNLSVCRVSF